MLCLPSFCSDLRKRVVSLVIVDELQRVYIFELVGLFHVLLSGRTSGIDCIYYTEYHIVDVGGEEDLEYDDIMASDSDDENYQIQFYDSAIRKTQSKLLKRIKREIVNSAL